MKEYIKDKKNFFIKSSGIHCLIYYKRLKVKLVKLLKKSLIADENLTILWSLKQVN